MKKKGRKGNAFRRLFAGADEPARNSSERPGATDEFDPDADDTLEDIIAKYGKYLDEDGVPFRGINPNPKYYVVPKEPPKPVLKKAKVRKVQKAKPAPDPVVAPEPETAPAPKKVTVKKVKKPTKVTVKKKSKAKP